MNLVLLSIFAFKVVLFFLWGSSSTLYKDSYSKIIMYGNEKSSVAFSGFYRIITYNIGYLSGMTNNQPMHRTQELFDTNIKKVIKEINKLQPDIIALQEIDYSSKRSYEVNQQDEIANSTGYTYVAQTINWDKTYVPYPYWPPSTHFGKIVSGQTVLSKHPLKNLKRIVLERVKSDMFYRSYFYLDRMAEVVTVNLSGKDIIIINVHLEAFDFATRSKQIDEVIELFTKYRTENPTFLLGDFNSDPNYKDAAIKRIFELPDIGNAAFSMENLQYTFNTENPYERLDYIFYDKRTINYIGGQVLTQFGQASDHFPIEMRFTLK